MNTEPAAAILQHLSVVDAERTARRADPELQRRVEALKHYQQRRFELTYADMLTHPRFAGAARFFLDELYGPTDFTQRDAQFARIVPALVRLFPHEVVETVAALAALHALSERFDTAMARALGSERVDADAYVRAWQRCGDVAGRAEQVSLMVRVGEALDALTRNPLLRHSLRLMRLPARAAGLAALQAFLEAGFDTFRSMRGAAPFLEIVEQREGLLAARLFDATPGSGSGPLGELP
jgi:hypothetical protein